MNSFHQMNLEDIKTLGNWCIILFEDFLQTMSKPTEKTVESL